MAVTGGEYSVDELAASERLGAAADLVAEHVGQTEVVRVVPVGVSLLPGVEVEVVDRLRLCTNTHQTISTAPSLVPVHVRETEHSLLPVPHAFESVS